MLRDLDDRDAETALDRRADLASLQRESGVGDGAVDHGGFRDRAEIDVGFLEAALGGKRLECRALGKLVGGRLRLLHVRKHDLLDVTALRRLEARVALLRRPSSGRRPTPRSRTASSAGVSTTSVILRYSGARNTTLRSSKYLASTSGVGGGISPAWAGPSATYSIVRSSFWKRLKASSAVFGTIASPLIVPTNCWRSAVRRCSARKRASV